MNKEDVDFLISIQDLEQTDFDNACLERENKRLNKEIDRLNNIINEFEKLYDKQGMYGEVEFKENFGTIIKRIKGGK